MTIIKFSQLDAEMTGFIDGCTILCHIYVSPISAMSLRMVG